MPARINSFDQLIHSDAQTPSPTNTSTIPMAFLHNGDKRKQTPHLPAANQVFAAHHGLPYLASQVPARGEEGGGGGSLGENAFSRTACLDHAVIVGAVAVLAHQLRVHRVVRRRDSCIGCG